MTKSCFGLHHLSVLLLLFITLFSASWSLPAVSDVILDYQHEHSVEEEEEKANVDERPMYEFQLAVWPDEYLGGQEQNVDSSQAPQYEVQEVVYPESNPTWHIQQTTTTTTKRPHIQQSVYPDDQFDHEDETVGHGASSTAIIPNVPKPHVEVVEQYQLVHPNGTTEYKLVLSNGMRNYKKIYNKLLANGKVVTVQEGYDSVPIPGDDPYSTEFQTQFYIADEHGHNVYRVEKHTKRTQLPLNLGFQVPIDSY